MKYLYRLFCQYEPTLYAAMGAWWALQSPRDAWLLPASTAIVHTGLRWWRQVRIERARAQ